MAENIMKMIAGIDVGNGYVKGMVQIDGNQPEMIDFASTVAENTVPSGIKTVEDDIPDVMEHIFDELDASFDSSAIPDTMDYLTGQRAILSGQTCTQFDVQSIRPKAEQSLSAILVLTAIAGASLRNYYAKNKSLPKDILKVNVDCLTVALPITEYRRTRKQYAEMFKSSPHLVMVHNFEQPVRVEIKIKSVNVLAEGAAAQYAIVAHGEPMMNMMLDDLRSQNLDKSMLDILNSITANDVLMAGNTIGIDVGEGTVNIPVFQNGKFNPDSSKTLAKGYGTVLENAREYLATSQNSNYATRKDIDNILRAPVTGLRKSRQDAVQLAVDRQINGLVGDIDHIVNEVLGRIGSYVEVIYVYGGGATPIKNKLYPRLLKLVSDTIGKDIVIPILYLDSEYSRYLNREGMFMAARQTVEAGKGKS